MSSTLWLLLYLAPLLGLTAAVFGWFGWQWRGRELRQEIKEVEPRVDEALTNQPSPETESPPPQDTELTALREELKSAQSEIRRRDYDTAKAHEAARALEEEAARLLRDMDLLRAERDQAKEALAAVQSELTELRSAPPSSTPVVPEAPAKPKRKRSTAAKPKETPPATLRDKVAALETRLAEQKPVLAALTQERDDWRRRVSHLEEVQPADPAGLGLARRSLADSEKRLLTTTTEIERLQNQTQALRRSEEKAAALAGVADDDLTQIKGIKKVIREQLHAHGIRTWRQIAQWDENELRAFSEILAFKNRAAREKWQEQARALHEAAHGPLS
ncbi:hypothetical protein [Prosthecobacter sp.]|uniref:hypothetical protein n=1 Tax=Prosthecobacter sp. TaxID=1965333 RepID=UPI001DC71771|nr:hypothetical protein [Prosthecobacter sp.]MCB1277198.1 hypothetical protein [Prosthecobacter sp.]